MVFDIIWGNRGRVFAFLLLFSFPDEYPFHSSGPRSVDVPSSAYFQLFNSGILQADAVSFLIHASPSFVSA